jgi:hypothetical protein
VTDTSRKQLVVLAVLVIVLIGVWFMRQGDAPSGAPTRTSNQRAAAGGKQAPLPVADVNLEALKADDGAPAEPERNPFVFKQKAPPPPPPRPVAPPDPVETGPVVPPGPPPPPPIPLKFIGVLEIPSQNTKVAVLSDGRGGTFHAKEGEVVLGQYKLIKIGAESAEMSYVDGRGRQTLRLSGQ